MKKYIIILTVFLLSGCAMKPDLIVDYHQHTKNNIQSIFSDYRYYFKHQIIKFNDNEVVMANESFLNYIKLGVRLYEQSNGKFNFVDQDSKSNNVLSIAFNNNKIKSNGVKINQNKLLDSYLVYQIIQIDGKNIKSLKYKNIIYRNNRFAYRNRFNDRQIMVVSDNPIKSEVKTYQYQGMKVNDIAKDSNSVDEITIKNKCSYYLIKKGIIDEEGIYC